MDLILGYEYYQKAPKEEAIKRVGRLGLEPNRVVKEDLWSGRFLPILIYREYAYDSEDRRVIMEDGRVERTKWKVAFG